MSRIGKIARRTFLVGTVAIAGGVAFGYYKYREPYGNPLLDDLGDGEAALTPYVKITKEGVTVITPRAEMGQGVQTTLAALVAEELDIALADVRVEHGPASYAYFNGAMLREGTPFPATDQGWMARNVRDFTHVPAKFLAMQITGGSSSIPDGYEKMRVAGAAARTALVAAAARKTGIDARSLKTGDGAVTAPDGTRLSYTALAADVRADDLPSDPTLKHPNEWKILGKPQDRVDMVSKCTGTAEFGIDVRLPDMLHATVRMNPRLGGSMESFDAAKAQAMPGVKKVVDLGYGVAVIASNTWYAIRAARAVSIKWGAPPYPMTTAGHWKAVEESFTDDREESVNRDDGDVDAALTGDVIELEYRAPYLAHATMEPMNAVAWLRDGRLDVWAGNQAPTFARQFAAETAGLEEEAVAVHTPYMGGGFGRRAELDFVRLAVRVAMAAEGTPVKTTWSREEDTCHDVYRPLAIGRIRAKVEDGTPNAFDIKLAAPGAGDSFMGRAGVSSPGPDSTIVQAAWDQPYGIANYRATAYKAPELLPLGFWRSVGASQNAFFHESALDEIAVAAGKDPVEMRLELMTHEPSRKVLEAVAEMAGWKGGQIGEGRGRGVAYSLSFGVPVAEIVEVAVTDSGIKVVDVWAAADVGTALDPRNIEAQLVSGVNFGLSAAILSEITVADGVVEQENFNNYDALRLYQAPRIAVRVLESGGPIRGIGEPGTPPAAPALANAIFAATGKRLREMPFNKTVEFV